MDRNEGFPLADCFRRTNLACFWIQVLINIPTIIFFICGMVYASPGHLPVLFWGSHIIGGTVVITLCLVGIPLHAAVLPYYLKRLFSRRSNSTAVSETTPARRSVSATGTQLTPPSLPRAEPNGHGNIADQAMRALFAMWNQRQGHTNAISEKAPVEVAETTNNKNTKSLTIPNIPASSLRALFTILNQQQDQANATSETSLDVGEPSNTKSTNSLTIPSFLTYSYSKEGGEDDEICSICKVVLLEGDQVTQLPVIVQSFHTSCIVGWLKMNLPRPDHLTKEIAISIE